MKSISFPRLLFWQRFLLSTLALLSLGLAGVVEAAPGVLKRLPLKVTEDGGTAVVNVPPGYATVALHRFERESGWKRIAVKEGKPGVMKFKLPASEKSFRWRALGRFEVKNVSRKKFPASFYAGNNKFGPLKNRSAGNGWYPSAGLTDGGSGVKGNDEGAAPPGAEPVEADIWKTHGNIVYFFNQLRGLQVLDVSDPADPRLTASLRLPALGQDLYLLPGATEKESTVALLTEGLSEDGWNSTVIQIVRVSDGKAELTHSRKVKGTLSDSRMVGNRLILATSEWSGWETYEYTSTTRLTEWILTPGVQPELVKETKILGNDPLIAAGANWLAVSVTPDGRWNVSDVTVFGIEPQGLVRLTAAPVRTAGRVDDQFKIQWKNHVLTTISEKSGALGNWSPITVLENFRVWGPGIVTPAVFTGTRPLLGSLELADGESLFATRFAGDKAYVVTFLQTDPLWVVDLSDPEKPVVAGHLEIPGWSTHLEPIGNYLFSVGWESNTVAASLFDVTDPAKPTLLRRLNLGAPGSYSEAAWDEKALKVIAEAGLAMIPLTTYDADSGKSYSSVQLLDIDLAKGDLLKRGSISHDFDARRSDLVGDTVFSISQRVLVAAGIADRDAPKILSEVSLAWPVDRVLDAGNHLIQIESGNAYGNGRATARVSSPNDPEKVFSETDLGKGTVRSADFRDGKLYVLRENASPQPFYYRSPVIGDVPGKITLDVYDASALPALGLLGSVATSLDRELSIAGPGLVWPQPNRPAVIFDARPSYGFWWGGPVFMESPVAFRSAVVSDKMIAPFIDGFPYWRQKIAPAAVVFDVSEPSTPTAHAPVTIGTKETIPNTVIAAADGLIVLGATDWRSERSGLPHPNGTVAQSVHVIEISSEDAPIVRPGIDLPGELFAVTELDRRGFLAFTRNFESAEEPAYKVSACDGFDAFEIAGLPIASQAAATAGGRQLFIASPLGVKRLRLSDDGTWVRLSDIQVGWQPDTLRWAGDTLLGSNWRSLFAATVSEAGTLKTWKFPTWGLQPENITFASDGDLLVPFGEYGAERLER